MAKFVSREKLSKKARKELDSQKRTVWAFSPTTKKVESKKLYNRKKSAHAWKNNFGMSAFCFVLNHSAKGNYCMDRSLCKYLTACSLSQVLSFTVDHCHTRNSVLL